MSNFDSQAILVTGATGFLGANLVRALISLGARVHIIMRSNSDTWRIQGIRDQLSVHTYDLVEETNLTNIVKKINPHVIYHLAVSRDTSTSQDRVRALKTNLSATIQLLEAAKEVDCLRIIYAGSSQEYGREPGKNQQENILKPASLYAASKAAASLLCEQYAEEQKSPVVILRFFYLYGYYEPLGRLIPRSIFHILANKPIQLTDQKYRRDFLYMEDAVNACISAAQIDDANGKVFNIGSGEEYSNHQMIKVIERVLNREATVSTEILPPRATDLVSKKADITRAKEILGWQPQTTFEAGIEKTVRWIIENQHFYPR